MSRVYSAHVRTPSLLSLAVCLAVQAHEGQLDKAGQPYVLHVLRVGAAGKTEDEQVVGLLHDVIEDTKYDADVLSIAGIPDRLIDAIEVLTRKPPYDYAEYIEAVSKHPLATAVKLNDLDDHLNNPAPAVVHLLPRYFNARTKLKAAQHA